jgi:hypothetical protein
MKNIRGARRGGRFVLLSAGRTKDILAVFKFQALFFSERNPCPEPLPA